MKLTRYLLDLINMHRFKTMHIKAKDKRYKYNTSICAIAKNEESYLIEWLDHHLNLGFNHVYIIDNNDQSGLREFLSDYLEEGFVTIIDFHNIKPSNQVPAYEYCLLNYGHESRWMAFIDIDEFIILKQDKDINTFLNRYLKYPSILMNWVMYGSNGQIFRQEGGVKNRFLQPATEGRKLKEMNQRFKSILQPVCFLELKDCAFRSAHRWSFPVFNEHKQMVLGETNKQSTDYIMLNHYWSKSYEEFVERCNRGEVIGGNKRYTDFFYVNPESMTAEIEKYDEQRK